MARLKYTKEMDDFTQVKRQIKATPAIDKKKRKKSFEYEKV